MSSSSASGICAATYSLSYMEYYNCARTHLSLNKDAPVETAVAISKAASLTARSLARLESEATRVMRESETAARSFQMVASSGHVTALIKTPGLTLQYQDGVFAVDVTSKDETTEK
jgi:hypothetical protein